MRVSDWTKNSIDDLLSLLFMWLHTHSVIYSRSSRLSSINIRHNQYNLILFYGRKSPIAGSVCISIPDPAFYRYGNCLSFDPLRKIFLGEATFYLAPKHTNHSNEYYWNKQMDTNFDKLIGLLYDLVHSVSEQCICTFIYRIIPVFLDPLEEFLWYY